MARGIIKWFNAKKGFGFIRQEKGDDVFFNHAAVNRTVLYNLNEGDKVHFEIDEELLGLSAKKVQRV